MESSHHPRSGRGGELSTRIGFLLWRGGLAFCALYLFYQGFARVVRVLLEIGVPAQLVWGLVFLALGFCLLIGSLIVERVIDARAERGLKDL
ncbi:MAG: hypothetical protein KDD65_17065 [Bacteroidetes bacterium]|nr:hypothetical protein [Bacteroidota bacterium]